MYTVNAESFKKTIDNTFTETSTLTTHIHTNDEIKIHFSDKSDMIG